MKVIDGYEDYMVDENGNIFSKKRKRMLKLSIYKGYKYIGLRKNGKQYRLSVHRLVAKAFCDNPNNYNEIDHIDGNPLNNHYSNLRWCNHTENMNNKNFIERKTKYKNIKVYTLGGKFVGVYKDLNELQKLGFDRTYVRQCLTGERKTYRYFIFEV